MKDKLDNSLYDKYKPFKDVEVGKEFIFQFGRYEKREVTNILGNNVNAFRINPDECEYVYISDYDWVIELN